MAPATITAKQLAQACETDPKTFRRFLREHLRGQDIETPGQGGRYAFTKGEAKRLVSAFSAWKAPKVKAAKAETEGETVELTGEELSELEAALQASIDAAEAQMQDDSDEDGDEDPDGDEDVEPEVEDDEDSEVEDLDEVELD